MEVDQGTSSIRRQAVEEQAGVPGGFSTKTCISTWKLIKQSDIRMIVFITDSWSISQTQSYNTRAQKMVSHTVAHYRIGICTRPTLRGANSTPTEATFTHHNAGIQ